jgi:hypothetical protein
MASNGPVIPNGRTLSDATIEDYAEQVLAVLKMWGFNRADALRLAGTLKWRITTHGKETWKDPLEGTGLHTDKAVEGGIMRANEDGTFNFGKFKKDA